MKIYLVGYISTAKGAWAKCAAWRNEYKLARPGYTWIDPMDGESEDSVTDEGMKGSYLPGKAIVHRDLRSVKSADAIVANTDTFGNKRPLIGSVFEWAWSYLLQKPVLIEVPNKDDYYARHPFVQEAATFISSDRNKILEALDYIRKGIGE